MRKVIFLLIILSLTTLSFGQPRHITVKLHSVIGYGQNEEFAKKAATALEQVLNSDEFRTRMLAMTYLRTNGLTNQQLYDKIMTAHEEQGDGGQDGVVDLRVRTLRIDGNESKWKDNCEIGSHSGTIGIDGNGDGVTAICPQRLTLWVSENNVAELSGHYAHEYMHILGFGHSKFLGTQAWREKTFVYKIGNLVSELVEKQMKANK
ncbi:MAG: hypothetical protein NTX03_09655 [Bacteroidetes bacterium]|nr:hypothetical protein [Bacteroidota bacterium]